MELRIEGKIPTRIHSIFNASNMPSDAVLPFALGASLCAGFSTLFIGNYALSVAVGLTSSSLVGLGNLALRTVGIMSVIESKDRAQAVASLSTKQRANLFAHFYRSTAVRETIIPFAHF